MTNPTRPPHWSCRLAGLAIVAATVAAASIDAAAQDGLLFDESPALVTPGEEMPIPLFSPGLQSGGLLLDGAEPMLEAERAIQEELEMGPRPSFPLSVSARLGEDGRPLPDGLVWRVFRAETRGGGAFELVEESESPAPSFLLPADDYIVHVAYGLANAATRVSLRAGPVAQQITLSAGGLRLVGVDATGQTIPERLLAVSVYSSEEEEHGQRRQLLERAAPGAIIRLNPGTYHVVSRYGDANAVVRGDVQVKPGELTDTRIQHRAASMTFKLVNEPGGEALADTHWTILTPEGETVKESFGAFPTHVLAEGNYALIARHGGSMFNREFDVVPGLDQEVELVAR